MSGSGDFRSDCGQAGILAQSSCRRGNGRAFTAVAVEITAVPRPLNFGALVICSSSSVRCQHTPRQVF